MTLKDMLDCTLQIVVRSHELSVVTERDYVHKQPKLIFFRGSGLTLSIYTLNLTVQLPKGQSDMVRIDPKTQIKPDNHRTPNSQQQHNAKLTSLSLMSRTQHMNRAENLHTY